MKNKNYNIIVTIKPWNIDFFNKNIRKLKGNWILITKPSELTLNKLNKISIDNIYFIHWSRIIPKQIYKRYNCISFHMTDLPYGRGGSPLQNLIIRKQKNTKISAFKVNNKIDGGPIYLKKKLKLNGSAQEIFIRAVKIVFQMIKQINITKLDPKPQKTSKITFKRLTKKDNFLNLKKIKNLDELYDRIRMVDAPEYPDAYTKNKNFIFNFTKVKKIKNVLYSSVKITFSKN
tara:strand:- start:1237 stop:1932 length:696 start_codon:yes stop_codon:yes gene_type:complete